ncbi:MAG: response regulator [Candidatus Omnitrophica bacterium]|nr:response regulator [Candidatus Omnitrophota bacterium]
MSEGTKLLIVDDDLNQCKTLKKILDAKGYQVFTAVSSQEAVKLVTETEFGLVLMDLLLKGDKNGVEIFREIKKVRPGIKVMLFTGFGPEEERRLLMEAQLEGMIDEFLRKPIELEELIKAVEKHVK